MAAAQFNQGYNSFSGADITAFFNDKPIGTLQGISWSITREKAPIYTMGDPDPRAYARGKRGIAGSLVFIQFDRHALLTELALSSRYVVVDKDSLMPKGLNGIQTVGGGDPLADVFGQETGGVDVESDQDIREAWFADQLLPMDITLVGANEYGAESTMKIYGMEILNEGSGTSIDDIVIEQQMTYVARTITHFRRDGDLEVAVRRDGAAGRL